MFYAGRCKNAEFIHFLNYYSVLNEDQEPPFNRGTFLIKRFSHNNLYLKLSLSVTFSRSSLYGY